MALYYTKGTISYMSEVVSGVSNSGTQWSRMTIVIEIPGYQGTTTKLALQVGSARIDDVMRFQVGDSVEIGWSIYARDYKGKWYNSVDLVNIKSQEEQRSASPAPAAANTEPIDLGAELETRRDDLPF